MRTISLFSLALLGLSTTAVAAPSSAAIDRTAAATPVSRTLDSAEAPVETAPHHGTVPRGGTATEPEVEAETRTTVGSPRTPTKGKKGKKGAGKGKAGQRGGANKGRTGKRKGFKIDEVRATDGVLTFGPKLGTHDKYDKRTQGKKSAIVAKKDLPDREVNRKTSLAAGLRAGTLMHGYQDGSSYSDLGLGLMVRYRPTEAVGLELGLNHHADTLLGSDRGQTLISGSAEVFAFPWSRLSPYALAGLTRNGRNGTDGMSNDSALTGAHIGAGVELGLGKSMALDVEARYIGWLNRSTEDQTNAGATSINAGLTFHF